MRRVLVIRFSALGDIALTLPALKSLAEQRCEIHFLTKRTFEPLLRATPFVSHIHCVSNHATFRELWEAVNKLKKIQFDQVFDLHRNLRSRIVGALLKVPLVRIKKYRLKEFVLYVFRRRIFRLFGWAPIHRSAEALRVTQGDLNLIEQGAMLQAPSLEFRMANQLSALSPRGYVCVALESAWEQKQWRADRFIALANEIRNLKLGVAWIGLRKLPEAAKNIPGTLDLTGQLTLHEVSSVLGQAKLLVCNDSGLLHIAEAVGTPVVAVFGPTTAELGFAPRLAQSRIAEAELWCRPCSKTGRACFRPKKRFKCLDEVSVASVYNQVVEVLKLRETHL